MSPSSSNSHSFNETTKIQPSSFPPPSHPIYAALRQRYGIDASAIDDSLASTHTALRRSLDPHAMAVTANTVRNLHSSTVSLSSDSKSLLNATAHVHRTIGSQRDRAQSACVELRRVLTAMHILRRTQLFLQLIEQLEETKDLPDKARLLVRAESLTRDSNLQHIEAVSSRQTFLRRMGSRIQEEAALQVRSGVTQHDTNQLAGALLAEIYLGNGKETVKGAIQEELEHTENTVNSVIRYIIGDHDNSPVEKGSMAQTISIGFRRLQHISAVLRNHTDPFTGKPLLNSVPSDVHYPHNNFKTAMSNFLKRSFSKLLLSKKLNSAKQVWLRHELDKVAREINVGPDWLWREVGGGKAK
eukprot:gb/GECH01007790.1/.p1 GENE.gb/GECH01007790.1/~~gb/GECH01007790.1/.p1  ORF type:complete len:357 (+),score=70.95 gb/GECH01007790.1/:1-1071(+)